MVLGHTEEILKCRQYVPFEHVKGCVKCAVLIMLDNISYLSTKFDKGIFSAIFQMTK